MRLPHGGREGKSQPGRQGEGGTGLLLLFPLFKSFIISFFFCKLCVPNEIINYIRVFKYLEHKRCLIIFIDFVWHTSVNFIITLKTITLEFGVILNFAWVLNCRIYHGTVHSLRSRILKNSVLLKRALNCGYDCSKGHRSVTQKNKQSLFLCALFLTMILCVLIAFLWPWGMSCWYIFVISLEWLSSEFFHWKNFLAA